ncbi:MAG: T9SS type A sorting domain-containing protein [Ignavibacteriaceae bacterium]|nr:T9SS type A sorting domain-containing protein [Ignavibacteriaceae bacterium]
MKQLLLVLVLVQVAFGQWVSQQLPTQSKVILGVSMLNFDLAAIGGWGFGPFSDISARGYYTSNGGALWNVSTLPDSARVIVDIGRIYPWGGLIASGARNLTTSNNPPIDVFHELKEAQSRGDYHAMQELKIGKFPQQNEQYEGTILKSTDFGATWQFFGDLPDSVTYLKKMVTGTDSHNYNNIIYVCASMNGGDRIIASTDTGKTWQISSPFIPGLTLNDVTMTGWGIVFAAGYIADATSSNGVVLNRDENGIWKTYYFAEVSFFSTVASTMFGEILAGGQDHNPNNPNAVIYGSRYVNPDSIAWIPMNFNGAGKVINRIKFYFYPWSAMSIILADTLTASGFKPLIIKNTPDVYGWMTDKYFSDSSVLFLDDADLYTYQDGLVGGMGASSGLVLYNHNLQLPVELTSFTASQTGNTLQLRWSTASETNNHGFEIERSTDNNRFYSIGFVKGAGSTQEPQEYIYTDSPDKPGTYYYRLKQTDFNATYKYSDVITAAFSENIQAYILEQNYPNPFNPSTRIKFSIPQQNGKTRQLVTLTVYDILGNEIAVLINEEKPSGTYEVDFTAKDASLSAGVYVYRLRAGAFSETKTMILLK